MSLATEPTAELRKGWKPGIGHETGDVTTPLFYRDAASGNPQQMLVLANDEGAAAIRFTSEASDPETSWTKYEYRYESFDGKTTLTDKGELFEQRNLSGTLGGNVHIEIKGLRAGWSKSEAGRCWIYYAPEKTRVHVADARTFEPRRIEGPFDEGKAVVEPPLDLQKFRVK